MRVFFGGVSQGFGRFRHSPIPTKRHLELLAGGLVGYRHLKPYLVGLRRWHLAASSSEETSSSANFLFLPCCIDV